MKKLTVAAFILVCAAQIAMQGWIIYRWEDVLRHGKAFKFRTAPVDPYDAFRGRYVALGFDATRVSLKSAAHPYESYSRKRLYAIVEEGPDGFARFASLQEDAPASGNHVKVVLQYVQQDPWFQPEDIVDPEKLAREILRSDRPICAFIRKKMMEDVRKDLEAYVTAPVSPAPAEVMGALMGLIQTLQYESLPEETAPEGGSYQSIYRNRLALVLKEFAGCLNHPPPATAVVNLPFDRFYMEESKAPRAETAYWQNSRRGQQRTYALVRILRGQAVIENVFIGDKPISAW